MIFEKGFGDLQSWKKKRQARRSFYSNPYAFAKKLFVESKSDKLDVPKEELENHLRMTYSDYLNGIPIPPLWDLPKPQDPTVMFDDSRIKLKEVWNFVHKAGADSAPSMNGISYKLYKNLPTCPQETHCPPSPGLEEGYCTTGMVSGWWYLDTKGNTVKRYHKYPPNIPSKCWGENIFWSSCSPYDNLSNEQSLYKIHLSRRLGYLTSPDVWNIHKWYGTQYSQPKGEKQNYV